MKINSMTMTSTLSALLLAGSGINHAANKEEILKVAVMRVLIYAMGTAIKILLTVGINGKKSCVILSTIIHRILLDYKKQDNDDQL